ncbi:MAG: hypothetical protein A4E62_01770 [Syntrophorhabdus sp. PtaU1.Bin002]|nr:MAG: hypothetical protein A4E62_01770 [Syntrophorhabdus sp. PtaU1.Bin002]
MGRIDLAFQDDLCACGNRQPGKLSLNDLNGFAPQRADDIIGALRSNDGGGTGKDVEGIAADDSACRHFLPCLCVFLQDSIGLLAFKDLHAHGLVVKDAHPVRTKVDVARVRVLNNHEYGGAEVTPTIQFVVLRRWEGENVDFVAVNNILKDRTILHFLCRDHTLGG